jgi:drug/metabolite transporter (DMT)-like permease
MSEITSRLLPARSCALEGIVCVEIGMLLFVVQDGMMKGLLESYPIWMLISIRGVIAALVLIPTILVLGGPHRLVSPLWRLHFTRAGLFAVGFSCFYAAFPFMKLAEVSTIFFSAPLLTALFASLFLGERIGPHRLAALVVGFVGVIIAMNPTGDGFHWIALLPLITAFTYACSQIIARRIGDRDSTLTMGLYTVCMGAALMVPGGWLVNQLVAIGPEFPHLRWEWPSVPTDQLPYLMGLGCIGMVGYMVLTRAYQIANASLIAPFDYTYLPIAAVMAYVVWDEVPDWRTIAGMVMIIAAGLYIGFREVVSHRRQIHPTATAEAIFVLSNPMPAVSPAEDQA